MKLIVNTEYEHLRSDIENAISGNYVANKVFCHKRNVVERFTMHGKEYVIKIFKRPNWFNRVVYTLFRKSKAERAYMNALRLLGMGIETPMPVAYAEKKSRGLFTTGYLITEYLPYNLLCNAYSGVVADKDKRKFTKDFMDFTLEMHSKGVLPLDFNASNIFYHYDEDNATYSFALTDINRMRFGKKPSNREVMRSFEQFGVAVDGMYKLAVYYCSRMKSDIEWSVFVFLFYRIKRRIKRTFKHKAKEKLKLQTGA